MTRTERSRRNRARRQATGVCLWCLSPAWYRSPMCRDCLARGALYKRNARRRRQGLPEEPVPPDHRVPLPCNQPPTLDDIRAWLAARRQGAAA